MMTRRPVVLLALAAAVLGGCGPRERKPADLRFWTDDLALRITAEPSPPPAREKIVWKVVVLDKETRQPIEGGEGRIFATSRDGARTWDALLPGPELGTYYGQMEFVTAGDWAMAIQFRRDSTQRLQRVDWMQGIRAARGEN